jgi:hypothetical protein
MVLKFVFKKKQRAWWSLKQPWRKMAEVEASESKELQEFIGFHEYYEGQPPCFAKTWTDEDLVSGNALFAKSGLADIMEQVVVGGRNAIKFKGPQAAEYLALHEDSNRRTAEFWQSDFHKNMQAEAQASDAKVRAGLFTVQELAPEYYIAEELDPIKAPKMCDLFTAEELEPLKNYGDIMGDSAKVLRNLLKEGARREKERLGLELPPEYYILLEELDPINTPKMCDLFTAEELKEYPPWSCLRIDYTQWDADRWAQWEADREKLLKLHEEAARRTSVWREDRKAKALQLGE